MLETNFMGGVEDLGYSIDAHMVLVMPGNRSLRADLILTTLDVNVESM